MSKSIVELVQHGEGPFTDDQGNACKLFQYKFKNGAQQFFFIKDFIAKEITKIPNYNKRQYYINMKFVGLAKNQGWMGTKGLISYDEVKNNLENYYAYLDDDDGLSYRTLPAQYFEIVTKQAYD